MIGAAVAGGLAFLGFVVGYARCAVSDRRYRQRWLGALALNQTIASELQVNVRELDLVQRDLDLMTDTLNRARREDAELVDAAVALVASSPQYRAALKVTTPGARDVRAALAFEQLRRQAAR